MVGTAMLARVLGRSQSGERRPERHLADADDARAA
jgi:hypothetical protein